MNSKIVGFDNTTSTLTEVKVVGNSLQTVGTHDSEMNTSLNNIETTLSSHSGYIDNIEAHHTTTHTKLDLLNTSVQANVPFNPNTPATYTNSRLGTIMTQQVDGTQKTLAFGANDILGNTPRCLTVDANGRLLTYPYEHPSSWTNTHLQTNHSKLDSLVAIHTANYEDVSLVGANNLITIGTQNGTAIDMNGFRHLVIKIRMLAMSGAGYAQNLNVVYSLDDSSYTIDDNEVISLKEHPMNPGEYEGVLRLKDVGFRYVQLMGSARNQNPLSYIINYSRSN